MAAGHLQSTTLRIEAASWPNVVLARAAAKCCGEHKSPYGLFRGASVLFAKALVEF